MKTPAVKYLACLLIGIIAGYYIIIEIIPCMILLVFALFFLILAIKFIVLRRLFPLWVFITGLILIQGINAGHSVYHNQITPEFKAFFKGKIDNVLSEKDNSSRYLISGYLNPELYRPVEKRLLLNVWKSGKTKRLIAGDSITANLIVRLPQRLTLNTDFDEIAYSRSQNFDYFAKAGSRDIAVHSRVGGYQKLLTNITDDIKSKLRHLFSAETYPVIVALITGDKSEIDFEVRKDFSITGTAHVLAVSGLHVGIISGIILVFLGWMRNRYLRFIFFTSILSFYIIITGLQPSALRAGTMAILIFVAYLNQRHINLLNIVSLAVIALIIIEPSMIFSIGFQMSVAALIGISIFMNPILRFFDMILPSENSILKFIKSSLSITFSVMLLVSPIIAYYFGTYSIISPVANILIVPLISIVMIYGILSLSLAYLIFPLAKLYAGISDFTINLIKSINNYLGSFSFSQIEFNEPVILSILLTCLLVYLFLSSSARQFAYRISVSIIIIFLSLQIINVKVENPVSVHPRNNSVLISVKTIRDNVFIILDRKPHIRQYRDYSLLNYVKLNRGNSIILINGNTGINIVDKLKETGKVKFYELKMDEIRKILGILNLDSKIFQVINLPV